MWKLFEADNAPKKCVIAFISNRTFLAGKPYAGLRKMLRERFDRIEVIDLRGDLRRGARAGVLGDEGVFNIQVGTAITIAVADGSKAEGALAEVRYTDVWEQGVFARPAKLAWLNAGATSGTRPGSLSVRRKLLEGFKPAPFAVQNWPAIKEAFLFASSGVETSRDHLAYGISPAQLSKKVRAFRELDLVAARAAFSISRSNDIVAASSRPFDGGKVVAAAYRPLDRRTLYNDSVFVDWPRPALQNVWGGENVGLMAMPFATGAGPGVWCHALLPDRHAFRGSYGGYAFPLFDRRAGHDPVNLSPALIEGLALAYHAPVEPQAVFDAILGLLSATSYTLRFAEDLEDVFPHIPFPADRAVFEAAAAVGKSIREVETFARPPGPAYLTRALGRIETTAHGPLAEIGPRAWAEGELTLGANGSGRVSGIPAAVWTFAVSGYPLLPRWLAGRKGSDLNDEFLKEFRDINGRINELIHRFDEADLVLEQALTHSLSRDELGLTPAANESDDERS
jgi:predicted helicase